MKIKGAIFDMDGTLLDSMGMWYNIASDYLIYRGLKPEEGINEKFRAMTIKQAAEYYQQNYGLEASAKDIIDDCNRLMEYNYKNNIKCKPGVIELLEELKNSGVKMCIATATDRYLVEATLKAKGIFDYFGAIFTASEVGSGKENPLMFERALDYLKTPRDETWVFEDALYSIKTAKAAGFKVAAIYDEYSKDDAEEIKAISDLYYESWK